MHRLQSRKLAIFFCLTSGRVTNLPKGNRHVGDSSTESPAAKSSSFPGPLPLSNLRPWLSGGNSHHHFSGVSHSPHAPHFPPPEPPHPETLCSMGPPSPEPTHAHSSAQLCIPSPWDPMLPSVTSLSASAMGLLPRPLCLLHTPCRAPAVSTAQSSPLQASAQCCTPGVLALTHPPVHWSGPAATLGPPHRSPGPLHSSPTSAHTHPPAL